MSIGKQRAFPIPVGGYLTDVGHQCNSAQFGMTYRQWLAGMALAHLAGTNNPEAVGKACVAFADAVIAELDKAT